MSGLSCNSGTQAGKGNSSNQRSLLLSMEVRYLDVIFTLARRHTHTHTHQSPPRQATNHAAGYSLRFHPNGCV
eukprot:2039915-Amphidinium_carterae.1